jgi:hypothetical protein
MTPKKNQSELLRYRDILLATIEYNLKRTEGRVKFDQLDPDAHFFQLIRQQTEKHYKQGRLKSLQKSLHEMTAVPRLTGDMAFGKYIKENTGYDIDIFENLQSRIGNIISQKRIKTEKEYQDVITMISLCQQTPASDEKIDRLNNLCNDFTERKSKNKSSERNRVITTAIRLDQVSEIYSPDNKRKLIIGETSDGADNPQTQVFIYFGKESGGIYAANGINLDIKVYLKDNSTVVIETKKDYTVITRYKLVQSFQDIVRIEYIEN